MDKRAQLYELSLERKEHQVRVDAMAADLKEARAYLRELTGHIDRLLGEIEADEAQG